MNHNDKQFNTVKAAGPRTSFARFLQRKAAEPTKKQFTTWDEDGGQGYDPNQEYFVIVQGRICRSPFQKIMAHLSRLWRSNQNDNKQRSRNTER
ncbi:MAG: hypothetical protein H7235_12180 [Bdellovibrionaceae bacterium]|nr:hypothetical protein [Pseudobdellovibrionaceae bacterium]